MGSGSETELEALSGAHEVWDEGQHSVGSGDLRRGPLPTCVEVVEVAVVVPQLVPVLRLVVRVRALPIPPCC